MALRNFLHQISPKYNLFPSSIRNLYCPRYYPSVYPKLSMRSMTENKLPVIEFEKLKDDLSKRNIILIDVREPKELKEDGTIPNSINIPLGQIVDAFKMPEADFLSKYGIPKPNTEDLSNFVLSCKSGKRATEAYQKLSTIGYKNMSVYSGSFQDWLKNGGPLEK